MRKLLLCVAITLFGLINVNAQGTSFGLTAGYISSTAKFESSGGSISESFSGFYVGGLADITLTEKFHVQPELLYASIEDGEFLIIPIMGKYYVSDDFNLQAGPQLNYSLNEIEDFTDLNFALAFGLGYDINQNIFVEAKYALQLNNSYTGPESGDFSYKFNHLLIGIGYKF